MKIGVTVGTPQSQIECPRCHGRHVLIEGQKAKCCGCSTVWNWREPRKEIRT